ncbi:unnamed protein product [Phytophthora fragariaefolia]|uniref:Unnamed protein product n=1 Tax=Phytophthora fragariaefolia TaxID=1490495 RepID=A0A9W7CSI5_9STRA|nr:unnamed protein product [Phytophthora fragariaefolia]
MTPKLPAITTTLRRKAQQEQPHSLSQRIHSCNTVTATYLASPVVLTLTISGPLGTRPGRWGNAPKLQDDQVNAVQTYSSMTPTAPVTKTLNQPAERFDHRQPNDGLAGQSFTRDSKVSPVHIYLSECNNRFTRNSSPSRQSAEAFWILASAIVSR